MGIICFKRKSVMPHTVNIAILNCIILFNLECTLKKKKDFNDRLNNGLKFKIIIQIEWKATNVVMRETIFYISKKKKKKKKEKKSG